MGWGNGIGIGWPNASYQNEQLIYFEVVSCCDGTIYSPGVTTLLVSNRDYKTGDYVYAPSKSNRVLLGNKITNIGMATIEITGLAYNSCP